MHVSHKKVNINNAKKTLKKIKVQLIENEKNPLKSVHVSSYSLPLSFQHQSICASSLTVPAHAATGAQQGHSPFCSLKCRAKECRRLVHFHFVSKVGLTNYKLFPNASVRDRHRLTQLRILPSCWAAEMQERC